MVRPPSQGTEGKKGPVQSEVTQRATHRTEYQILYNLLWLQLKGSSPVSCAKLSHHQGACLWVLLTLPECLFQSVYTSNSKWTVFPRFLSPFCSPFSLFLRGGKGSRRVKRWQRKRHGERPAKNKPRNIQPELQVAFPQQNMTVYTSTDKTYILFFQVIQKWQIQLYSVCPSSKACCRHNGSS